MAEKAKAKKAKALAKKTASVRPKKKEISVKDAYHEADAEELQLAQEETPKRVAKTAKSTSKKTVAASEPAKPEPTTTKAVIEAKPVQAAPVVETALPIQPRVTPTKPIQQQVAPQEQRHEKPRHDSRRESQSNTANDGLKIRLSESLVKKLKEQAADEGISLEEFVAELLAESVVLRAWEIVERKNAMKGPSGQGQQQGRGYNQNPGQNKGNNNNQRSGNHNNQGNKGHRGMTHARYQTIMDDKATFLEYVRNQEKSRR